MEQLVRGCSGTPGPHKSLPDWGSLLGTCSQVRYVIPGLWGASIGSTRSCLGDPLCLGSGRLLELLHVKVHNSEHGKSYASASIEQRTVQSLVAQVEPPHGLFRSMQELECSKIE
eukprot:874472-Pelagomonas_calceolata.AAC.1